MLFPLKTILFQGMVKFPKKVHCWNSWKINFSAKYPPSIQVPAQCPRLLYFLGCFISTIFIQIIYLGCRFHINIVLCTCFSSNILDSNLPTWFNTRCFIIFFYGGAIDRIPCQNWYICHLPFTSIRINGHCFLNVELDFSKITCLQWFNWIDKDSKL